MHSQTFTAFTSLRRIRYLNQHGAPDYSGEKGIFDHVQNAMEVSVIQLDVITRVFLER